MTRRPATSPATGDMTSDLQDQLDGVLKDRLLKARVGEATVTIEGVGDLRVRGLRRGEVFAIKKATEGKDVEAYEIKALTVGVIEPKLTEAEVRRWYKAAPAGEIDPVVDKIMDLSGLGQGADKSGVQETGQ